MAAATSLADRLRRLVTEGGFESFLDYYYFLKYDAAASDEWGRVMDALSVPETYFWREIDQLQAVAVGDRARARQARRRRPDPHLVRALRERRGAADAGDAAR